MTETPATLPTITGKCRVVKDIYDFKFYIEQQWSTGEWRRNHSFPAFGTVDDAHGHFQRSKAAKQIKPADLGDIDDV